MLTGQMMPLPLTLTNILRHAERVFPDTEIVSITVDEPRHRYTLRTAFARVRQLAAAFHRLDLEQGTRIATLAWNDHRHFEAYYAISCSGYVCHTINPRLPPAQIEYIINHAQDRVLLVDPAFVPLIEQLAPTLTAVRHFIVLSDDRVSLAGTQQQWLHYEALLAAQQPVFEFPPLDENAACSLAYTSGTTGQPKGVLYSHRSTVLHSYAIALPGAFDLSPRETVLTVVPMFHVNGWSLPYAAPMTGARQVLPGAQMGDAATLLELIESEGVTCAAGVPTVWMKLLAHLRAVGGRVPTLGRILVGGAACPRELLEAFEREQGVELRHAWGMTEMSPLGTVNSAPRRADIHRKLKQGQPIFGVELKIVDATNRELPWDGASTGHLKVRGPWVCAQYFGVEDAHAHDADGWFDTGDVATIDAQGYLQITDRYKDIIKSGGEWISSIELESAASLDTAVAEAAVIGVPDAQWGERPLMFVVSAASGILDTSALRESLGLRLPRWWLPEAIIQVDALPHTATGKLDKKALRALLSRNGQLLSSDAMQAPT